MSNPNALSMVRSQTVGIPTQSPTSLMLTAQPVLALVAGLVITLCPPCPAVQSANPTGRQLAARTAAQSADATTSFEDAAPGEFAALSTTPGVWRPLVGRTIVDDKHARTGKQCLHITGGESSSVELELSPSADPAGVLTFHAERWTRRGPFSFRIEKDNGTGWQEIYNGDSQLRVGRAFLTRVRVPLADTRIRRLRFRVTSPSGTGVLIDDLRIARPRPQRITTVRAVPVTFPVLLGTKGSPVTKLEIVAEGELNPISLAEVSLTLKGTTDPADVDTVWLSRSADPWKELVPVTVASTDFSARSAEQTTLKPDARLEAGVNTFWLGLRVRANANIDHRVAATARSVLLSSGRRIRLDESQPPQRLGVAVRSAGSDGVHTFRIPGLVTTTRGTLIGVYDIRRRSGRDLPGDIDVGMSRSTDGGRTWEPMRVIMDMGADPKWKFDGIGDPAVLVDHMTGTIWVAATWSHGNRSWNGSGPGMSPEETGQLMLVRSDDDGLTWSDPINITAQVKRPEWSFLLQGPGKGITMKDGTLVFAAQYQDTPELGRLPRSTIIYSRDRGVSWQIGTGAFDDTTESQVVELEPGTLMLNCRYNRKSARVVMTTRDLGATWQEHPTSQRALIEPRACMASLISAGGATEDGGRKWLLFSNPNDPQQRHRLSIRASPDSGRTWPAEHLLLLDEGRSAGYSCLTMIDRDTIGILYEGSRAHLTFQRIPLRDVVDGNTSAREARHRATRRRLIRG